MNLTYNVDEKIKFSKNIVFAIQQLLAIIAATLLVPTLVNSMFGSQILDQAAALFGAGAGTLTYILFTKKRSPVFLGSSFAFISPLASACVFGYCGIILGAIIAGLVYVIIAIVIRFVGSSWVDKLMPKVIIGPTVALIGLSLCSSAVSNLSTSNGEYNLIAIICGIIAFIVTCLASVKGNKTLKAIPFIIGILAGYLVASIFTAIGGATSNSYLQIVNFEPLTQNFTNLSFTSFFDLPKFTIVGAINEGFSKIGGRTGVAQVAVLFAPVAFVVFAEHIADHKNLSSVIGKDLIKDPGLDKTLLGDGRRLHGRGSIWRLSQHNLWRVCRMHRDYGRRFRIYGNSHIYTLLGSIVLYSIYCICKYYSTLRNRRNMYRSIRLYRRQRT